MKTITVIGGGIIGTATAFKLIQKYSHVAKIVLLEKETNVGMHQSTHNSGVLHSGLYYKPGSYKAILARDGLKQMIQFCKDNGIKYEQCGKLVVAVNDDETPKLTKLLENGLSNGLNGLKLLKKNELKDYEPHVAGVQGILVPEEGIVDFRSVIDTLQMKFIQMGGVVKTGFNFKKVREDSKESILISKTGDELRTNISVNCAGLYSDVVATAYGLKLNCRIIPFRGDYYMLKEHKKYLVKNLIYPVPDSKYPFLGVHFTRMINGNIESGPNAVLAFRREGYKLLNFSLKELFNTLSYKGMRTFVANHGSMALMELKSSISKKTFTNRLQMLIPEIHEDDLTKGLSGVRAQAISIDGNLIQDFEFAETINSVHLINAPSPGATASLAIADVILAKVNKIFK